MIVSYLQAIPRTFYSHALYREVLQDWQGIGFGYLLLVLAILCVPVTAAILFSLSSAAAQFSAGDFDYIFNQIPPMTFHDGTLNTEVPQPYYIRDRQSQTPLVVIDTTHDVLQWAKTGGDALVVGQHQILHKDKARGETRIYDFPAKGDFTLTRDNARSIAERIAAYVKILTVIFLYPLLLLAVMVYRMAQMLLYGLLTLGMGKIVKVPMEYQDAVRLACVACTPVLAADALTMMMMIHLPGLVFFALAMVCIYCAVKANTERGTVHG
ncbi:MAG: DUF1189 family protein [Alphaproteobacteria bacterium]|nr:DUF1189 family protein [Alphaproteobacteria bacterium]